MWWTIPLHHARELACNWIAYDWECFLGEGRSYAKCGVIKWFSEYENLACIESLVSKNVSLLALQHAYIAYKLHIAYCIWHMAYILQHILQCTQFHYLDKALWHSCWPLRPSACRSLSTQILLKNQLAIECLRASHVFSCILLVPFIVCRTLVCNELPWRSVGLLCIGFICIGLQLADSSVL